MNDFLIPEMIDYLQRIGHQPSDLNRLNVVHVTGTKGKGSTCSFVDSLFRTLTPAKTPVKVGLYTSPHMTSVRERIRIDSLPLSQSLFTKYFWETWDRFEHNPTRKFSHTPLRPVYFRFLTILAFHVFLSEKVDTVVLEVGIGGKYDSTNIVPQPAVAGIAQLGLDHTALLGNTVEEIATQKAGIFKPNAPAVCWAQQPGNAVQEVQRVAQEKLVSKLTMVELHPALQSKVTAVPDEEAQDVVQLGLPGAHQRTNASLALELVNTFLENNATLFVEQAHRADMLSDWQRRGLESARWPGRCQTVPSSVSNLALTWYLDGAHTTDSLAVCLEWYTAIQQQRHNSDKTRVLVFNCTNGRNAHELLSSILHTIQHRLADTDATNSFFDHVIFTTNITFDANSTGAAGWSSELASNAVDPADLTNLTVQKQLQQTWSQLVPHSTTTQVHITSSIQAMHDMVTSMARQGDSNAAAKSVECLVTGSLHLVGGVMAHLQNSGCLDSALVSTVQP